MSIPSSWKVTFPCDLKDTTIYLATSDDAVLADLRVGARESLISAVRSARQAETSSDILPDTYSPTQQDHIDLAEALGDRFGSSMSCSQRGPVIVTPADRPENTMEITRLIFGNGTYSVSIFK